MVLFVLHWIIATVAVFVTAYLTPGVQLRGLSAAFFTAVGLGMVNALLKPVLLFLTLPINVLTLGLFTLVINALLVIVVGAFVDGFRVKNFGWALVFSVVLGMVNLLFGVAIA